MNDTSDLIDTDALLFIGRPLWFDKHPSQAEGARTSDTSRRDICHTPVTGGVCMPRGMRRMPSKEQ